MDCYTQTFPIARKVHNCDFCGKQIEKGEKYSYASWKNDGKFRNTKLCLVCEDMCMKYAKEQNRDEYTYDHVADWLFDKYCYYCEHYMKCNYETAISACQQIRKHFESLESD